MAYATALSADNKVKFFIELPGFVKPVPVPVVIAPEPIVEAVPVKPVPVVEPTINEEVNNQKMEAIVVEEEKQEQLEQLQIEAILEDSPDEADHTFFACKGKKGKGKKGKHGKGKMPRRAIKNLIR